jgi:hypothetical protein
MVLMQHESMLAAFAGEWESIFTSPLKVISGLLNQLVSIRKRHVPFQAVVLGSLGFPGTALMPLRLLQEAV